MSEDQIRRDKEKRSLLKKAFKRRFFGKKKSKEEEQQPFRFKPESKDPRLSYSTCDGNWSLGRHWRNQQFEASPPEKQLGCLERLKRIRRKFKYRTRKCDGKILKEQLRYDRDIKRHIRIRFMLSMRLKRYMERRKECPRVPEIDSGRAVFDVHQAVNEMIARCHGDLRILDATARKAYAGNLR